MGNGSQTMVCSGQHSLPDLVCFVGSMNKVCGISSETSFLPKILVATKRKDTLK
ncbi:hypothetical protein STEG23_030528, partial [Scotinomys teguina]